ncbi:MFS transporter [Phenylobacterium sp.]|uniref:MFS transporter n=1 Tax=Phenylobacterium sp. TaxID=1871053 RepID=UPI002DF39A3E|nr:MFS transporter [Phenylobacterium sp.]
MTAPLPLWRQGDFRRLWAAQAVSDFGARITREGLPMMVVMMLAASPAQLGLLAAVRGVTALAVGLSAGAFVDRHRRRGILIASDLGRAIVLIGVPIAAWTGVLDLAEVFIAAALVAAASTLFDIADHAYLPSLVGREHVTEANAKLGTTESIAEMGGPALAGLLFQWLTAPFAVAVNAATYLVSAAFLARIQAVEAPPSREPRVRRWFDGVRTGVAAAWEQPAVRPLLLSAAISGVFGGVFSALYIVFALRVVGLTPALLGITIAFGGGGALLGSLIAQPLAKRFGIGPAIIGTALASAAAAMLIPLAPAGAVPGMSVLIVSQILGDAVGTATLILAVSLRQGLLAPNLLGRTGAAFQAVAGAAAVAGALGGGLLGQALGVRAALFIAAAGLAIGPAIAAFTPLRAQRKISAA